LLHYIIVRFVCEILRKITRGNTRPHEDGPLRETDWGDPFDEELTICTEGFSLPYVQGFSSFKPKELGNFLLNDVMNDDVLLSADNHSATAIL